MKRVYNDSDVDLMDDEVLFDPREVKVLEDTVAERLSKVYPKLLVVEDVEKAKPARKRRK